MNTLILGGARSGKSRLAGSIAARHGGTVVLIATAQALDEEMQQRIAAHRRCRNPAWQVEEEPLALGDAITRNSVAGSCVIVDCLTLWLTNLLGAGDPQAFAAQRASLLAAVRGAAGDLLLASNETGLGIVPANALTRRFIDAAGVLHQELAGLCTRVLFVTAGLPMVLKDLRQ